MPPHRPTRPCHATSPPPRRPFFHACARAGHGFVVSDAALTHGLLAWIESLGKAGYDTLGCVVGNKTPYKAMVEQLREAAEASAEPAAEAEGEQADGEDEEEEGGGAAAAAGAGGAGRVGAHKKKGLWFFKKVLASAYGASVTIDGRPRADGRARNKKVGHVVVFVGCWEGRRVAKHSRRIRRVHRCPSRPCSR